MKLAKSIRLGAWMLIALNLLMAFGSIWVFMRMTPAIEVIINQNENSLQACEAMLTALASQQADDAESNRNQTVFSDALKRAENNITETEEPDALQRINAYYEAAFRGDRVALNQTVSSITRLGEINRNAMNEADKKAKQIGNSGAWGVVFMASGLFFIGLLFIRNLKQTLVIPLEEIHAVIIARLNGDVMRRCTGKDLPKDIKKVYSHLNDLLDK